MEIQQLIQNSIIETGENGIGVYTANGNGYLESGSINVGKDGVGVYIAGNNGTITASNPLKWILEMAQVVIIRVLLVLLM